MFQRDIYYPRQPCTPEDHSVDFAEDLDYFEALKKELQTSLRAKKYPFLGSCLPQDRIYAQELMVAFSSLPFGIL